jgi:hypothetical protein
LPAAPALSRIRSFAEQQPVLIGYMRVSKADGSQTLAPEPTRNTPMSHIYATRLEDDRRMIDSI